MKVAGFDFPRLAVGDALLPAAAVPCALPVMAHDFRTRSAFHDIMFLSEL